MVKKTKLQRKRAASLRVPAKVVDHDDLWPNEFESKDRPTRIISSDLIDPNWDWNDE